MAKFKVGDKVRVIENNNTIPRDIGVKMVGQIVTVEEVEDGNGLSLSVGVTAVPSVSEGRSGTKGYWWYQASQLALVPTSINQFAPGMQVRVWDKSAGGRTLEELFDFNLRSFGYTATITRVDSEVIVIDGDHFLPQDLTIVVLSEPKEEPKDGWNNPWRMKAEISAESTLAKNPCDVGFRNYVAKYGKLPISLSGFDDFIRYANRQGNWISWLEEKGFIELAETHAVGDHYRGNLSGFRGHKFVLASTGGDSVALINIENGMPWTAPVNVKNHLAVSENEWSKITAKSRFFTKE